MSKITKNKESANRLRLLMVHLGMQNKTGFAERLGISLSSLSHYLNGREIQEVFMVQIKNAFPQVNISWLKTGKGEPLINSMVSEFQLNSNKEGGIVIDKEKEYLRKENEALKLKVEMLEEALARRSWELITKSGRISNLAKKNNRNNNDK